MQLNISEDLYAEIRSALNYEANQSHSPIDYLLNDLPLSLKMEVNMTLHKLVFKEFPLFTEIGDKYFITWIS